MKHKDDAWSLGICREKSDMWTGSASLMPQQFEETANVLASAGWDAREVRHGPQGVGSLEERQLEDMEEEQQKTNCI